jgi:hypothetical protein
MEPSTTPVWVIGEIHAGRYWKSDGESVGISTKRRLGGHPNPAIEGHLKTGHRETA